jgi:phage N-6-adenine-methyltransferase
VSFVEYDEDCTPAEIFNALDAHFRFTLDAAASKENAKCAEYIDMEKDAFRTEWHGRVFLNAPWKGLSRWIDRAIEQKGNCEVLVLLLPNRPSAPFVGKLRLAGAEITAGHARIMFEEGDVHSIGFLVAVLRGGQ